MYIASFLLDFLVMLFVYRCFFDFYVIFFFSSKISRKLYRYGFPAFIRKLFMNLKFYSCVFFECLISINREIERKCSKQVAPESFGEPDDSHVFPEALG